jgi:hypothetical protein
MGFLEKALMWFVEAILNWLASRLITTTTEIVKEKKEEKQVEVINAENVEKYKKAKTRIERIKAAEDLLNRVRR